MRNKNKFTIDVIKIKGHTKEREFVEIVYTPQDFNDWINKLIKKGLKDLVAESLKNEP